VSSKTVARDGLGEIRIVLVEPNHPGNIGAVARAMKTMSLSALYLVRPTEHPTYEAERRAVGAVDTLAGAIVVDRVEDAVGDCRLVIGSTARARSHPHPVVEARGCGRMLVGESESGVASAVLFGPERTGLSNRDLNLCNHEVRIPTNPDFASLNLASAVQLISYEILMARHMDELPTAPEIDYPSQFEMEYFYDHLIKTLDTRDFLLSDKRQVSIAKLRRLFGRARPETGELKLLHSLVKLIGRREED
jgi:tRNA (cytidine32/uridine32-2'-O)-methyltransferase